MFGVLFSVSNHRGVLAVLAELAYCVFAAKCHSCCMQVCLLSTLFCVFRVIVEDVVGTYDIQVTTLVPQRFKQRRSFTLF
jgi:hypothetical protein